MTNITSKRFSKYAFLFLSIVGMGILLFDVYFSVHGKGVCPTSACKIASQYGVYGAITFPIIGSIFFGVVFFMFFFYSIKNIHIFEKLLWLTILSSLSFDGVLIGYLFKKHIFCLLCIGVFLSLLLLLILFSIYTEKIKLILLGIAIWSASFIGINFLKLDVFIKSIDIRKSVMIDVPAKKEAKYRADLFVSLHCIHCLDVLYNLSKKKDFDFVEWKVHFLSGTKDDMIRISHMLKDKDIKKDPFGVILKYKLKKEVSKIDVPEFVKIKIEEARKFFEYNKFRGIPLLIMKTPEYEIRIIGDRTIGAYLIKQGLIDKWYLIKVR